MNIEICFCFESVVFAVDTASQLFSCGLETCVWNRYRRLSKCLIHSEEILCSCLLSSVQFSPLTDWVVGGTLGTIHHSEILSQSFLQEVPVSSFCRGKGALLSDVVYPAFPLPTTASPTLQGASRDGFGEVLVACDMPEPCKFPSLDCCQKRFLRTHKEVDLAPHPVVGLMLQVGEADKFPHAFGFECLDPSFRVSKQGPRFTAVAEDGGDKRLVELNPGAAPPDPF